MPSKPAPLMDGAELLIAHNVRMLAANGLSPERIAIDLRLKLAQVEAVLGGDAAVLRAATMHQPTPQTLAKAAEARRIVAEYTDRGEYLSGRALAKALGVSANWLSINASYGRKNPNYAWAAEMMQQIKALEKYKDPKMCRPKSQRGMR